MRTRRRRPALVYQEAELPLRVTRDLFTDDFEKALVDDDRTYKRIVGYLKKTSPHMVDRVIRYREKTPLFEADGRRRRDPLDALAPGRPALGRLPRLRLRRGVHGHRRQHRPLRRLALEVVRRAARGHDHGEQPRGGQGGRPPAPAARHRRDHRHRLHRHGEPEEPGDRRGGAEDRARARPDEDLRRRDLAARARRDDAPERDRRPARDPHAEVPDLRRGRHRPLHALGRDRHRAEAARPREERQARGRGVPRRARGERRLAPDRPGRLAADRDRGARQAPLLPRGQGGRAARPLQGQGRGQARRTSRRRLRSRRAPRSGSSSSRSASTTSRPASASSTG